MQLEYNFSAMGSCGCKIHRGKIGFKQGKNDNKPPIQGFTWNCLRWTYVRKTLLQEKDKNRYSSDCKIWKAHKKAQCDCPVRTEQPNSTVETNALIKLLTQIDVAMLITCKRQKYSNYPKFSSPFSSTPPLVPVLQTILLCTS